MSQAVLASFQSKFQNNVELVLQQQNCILENCVEVQDENGAEKIKVKDLIGNNLPQEADERHGKTKLNNTPHDGVWIAKPNELYFADLVDNADQLATTIDLKGAYTMSAAGTINRAKDRRILEGIYGSIISGKDGTTTTPFPAGNTIAVTVGGASGPQRFNTAKIRAANKLLMQNYVDMNEPRYMVLTAEQNDDLMTEVPVTSEDFKKVYQGEASDGVITKILGFNIIPMELANAALGTISALSLDGSGYRKTPFWVRSGVRFNRFQALRTSIDPRPDLLNSIQVLAGTTCAATRTQAGKVGIILNSEA